MEPGHPALLQQLPARAAALLPGNRRPHAGTFAPLAADTAGQLQAHGGQCAGGGRQQLFPLVRPADLLQRQPRTGDDDGPEPPALSRTEYLKLLRAARTGGQHRLYLLIKLFATTGVPLQCLDQVTAELVRQGRGTLNYRGSPVPFRCPPALRQELLDYMAETGIYRGPVFITRTGQVWNRSNIFRRMQELCLRAGVPEEKANPRCLRNLYKATQQLYVYLLAALKQQMYDQLLEMEQDAVGWPAGPDTGRGRPA